jgi:hypothetical protein
MRLSSFVSVLGTSLVPVQQIKEKYYYLKPFSRRSKQKAITKRLLEFQKLADEQRPRNVVPLVKANSWPVTMFSCPAAVVSKQLNNADNRQAFG